MPHEWFSVVLSRARGLPAVALCARNAMLSSREQEKERKAGVPKMRGGEPGAVSLVETSKPKWHEVRSHRGDLRGSRPAGPSTVFCPADFTESAVHIPAQASYEEDVHRAASFSGGIYLPTYVPPPESRRCPMLGLNWPPHPPGFTDIFRRTARSFPVWLV